ncbi:sugar ABC transporter substrate-binding protein [Gleimia hominis]|uniref:Sugar ABC transporter substrate-binding protein n=1 Tax=Gleimia hominis TaxID=595468 RepID=A0ABU3IBP2_9ACTO|nr:sugar ABC transporter substrate-binding protein [Gleimia hominis]MDT3766882.1 sugar ABC transporter substrate-binding protein [Gleimia hominis]
MKKTKLRKLIVAAAVVSVLSASTLAACESGSDTAQEDGDGSVTWSTWGTPDELKIFEQFNKKFGEEHPDLKVNFQPVASYTDYHSKLNTQLTSNTAPDVFYVGDDQIANLVSNNVLEPLDSHLNAQDSPISLEDFSESIYQVAQLDGKTYALPNDVNPDAFWYDKEALQAAGITEDPATLAEQDKWNTDAFFEMTDKLKSAGMTGAAFWNYWSTTDSIITSQGGVVYDDNGEYQANKNKASVDAIATWSERFKNGQFVVADILPSGQDADTLFVQHKLGFLVQGRYTVSTIEGAGNSVDQYDVVRWPTPDGKPASSGVAASFLAINKNAKDKDAAAKFLAEFLSKDGQKLRLSQSGNALPSIHGIDDIVSGSQKPAHVDALLEMRDNGYSNYRPEAVVPGLSDSIANEYMLPLYQGKKAAQKTLDEVAKLISEKTKK